MSFAAYWCKRFHPPSKVDQSPSSLCPRRGRHPPAWVRSPPTPTHTMCLLSAVGDLKWSLVLGRHPWWKQWQHWLTACHTPGFTKLPLATAAAACGAATAAPCRAKRATCICGACSFKPSVPADFTLYSVGCVPVWNLSFLSPRI